MWLYDNDSLIYNNADNKSNWNIQHAIVKWGPIRNIHVALLAYGK